MAWQANTDSSIAWRTMGATVLQASTTITTSTQSSGVFAGRGIVHITRASFRKFGLYETKEISWPC